MNWKTVAGWVVLLAALVLATLGSRWQAEAFFVLLIVAARVVQALIRGDASAPETMSRRIMACGVMLLVALAAAAALDARRQFEAFVTLLGAASIAYVAALRLVDRLARNRSAPRTDRRALAGCLLLAVLWRLVLLGAAPLVSDDAYRYVWDGRVQQHGLNPLETTPSDPALVHLHTDLTRRIDPTSAVLPSIYPPLAQRFFLGVTLVHESVLAMAAAVLVCDLLIVGLIWRWLAATGRSPWWVLAYAWHPLVALEGAGGAHVDVAGALLLIGAAYALSRRRSLLAAVGLAGAVAVKFLPVVLLPLFWKRIRLVDAAAGALLLVEVQRPALSVAVGMDRHGAGDCTGGRCGAGGGRACAADARSGRSRGMGLAAGGRDLPAAGDLPVVSRLDDPVSRTGHGLAARRLDGGFHADLHRLDPAPGGGRLDPAGVGRAGRIRTRRGHRRVDVVGSPAAQAARRGRSC